MRRKVATRSMGLLLGCAAAALAEAGPPPLTLPGGGLPPIVESSPAPPAAPVPVTPADPVASAPVRPLFRPTRRTLPTLEPSGPVADAPEFDLPPLTAPVEARPIGPAPSSLLPERGAAPPALTLESTPAGRVEPPPRARPGSARAPAPTPPAAPRRFRLFGRFQPTPSPAIGPLRSADDAVKIEPRTDPAADAALKRRLETQIREAVGAHLRELEVRVVDRSVTIRAQPDRFWRRRAVRRSIESLPALSGLKVKVDVEGD